MSEEDKDSTTDFEKDLKARVVELEAQKEMVMKLAAAGAKDIETAVLVGMSRLAGSDGGSVDEVVEEIRKEKGYLFTASGEKSENQPPARTAGARQRGSEHATAMERAAKRAAASGSRVDLQEYLRLRRKSR